MAVGQHSPDVDNAGMVVLAKAHGYACCGQHCGKEHDALQHVVSCLQQEQHAANENAAMFVYSVHNPAAG